MMASTDRCTICGCVVCEHTSPTAVVALNHAREGLWMTFSPDAANGWSAKQVALLDAIMALSFATADEPDGSTTAELARLVGCSVDEAWHALVLTDYAETDRDVDDTPVAERGAASWWLPEADWDDDDEEWYGRRIRLAAKLEQPGAVDYWTRELAAALEADR